MEKQLYPWQEDCLDKWFLNRCRGMVQAVTGSGKTLLALTAAFRLEKRLGRPVQVKIVVPTSGLMFQWEKAIREYAALWKEEGTHRELRGQTGLRGAGRKDPQDRRYMVYVVNSARYELARQILMELRQGEAVLLIADECHHYDSDQNRLIFEFLPHMEDHGVRFFSLGLSATLPSGQGRIYLESVLGRQIYTYNMAEASALSTVCPYDLYHIGISFAREERSAYEEITDRMLAVYGRLVRMYPPLGRVGQAERYEMLKSLAGGRNRNTAQLAILYMKLSYRRKSLVCLASARTACACSLVERLDRKEKILVFGEQIRQAQELCRLLESQYPGRVGQYHSGMGAQARRNVLERFSTGEIRILVTCRALDEGVDLPDVSVGIILSGTGTRRQRVQRLGRIIRVREGKALAALYYLHVTETSEDTCYLPDIGDGRIFELDYVPDTGSFRNPHYDGAAAELLRQMEESGKDAGVLREAGRCLEQGCVRADWLLDPLELTKRMEESRYARERNYWFCMRRVGELAEAIDSQP